MNNNDQSINPHEQPEKNSLPDEPLLGESQPLPNSEEPPGYEWQRIGKDAHLIDTKPVVKRVPEEQNLPTDIHALPETDNGATVKVNLGDKVTPPPGSKDALPNHVDVTDLSATRVSPSALRVKQSTNDAVEQPPVSRKADKPGKMAPVTDEPKLVSRLKSCLTCSRNRKEVNQPEMVEQNMDLRLLEARKIVLILAAA